MLIIYVNFIVQAKLFQPRAILSTHFSQVLIDMNMHGIPPSYKIVSVATQYLLVIRRKQGFNTRQLKIAITKKASCLF